MKNTLIYGAIGGLLIYLYLRSKKSKGENTSVPTKPYITDEFGQPKVMNPSKGGISKLDVPPAKPQTKPKPQSKPKPFVKPNPMPNPESVVKPDTKPQTKPLVVVDNKPYNKPTQSKNIKVGDKPLNPINRTESLQGLPKFSSSRPSFYKQRKFYTEQEQTPVLPMGDTRSFTIPRINQKRPAVIKNR